MKNYALFIAFAMISCSVWCKDTPNDLHGVKNAQNEQLILEKDYISIDTQIYTTKISTDSVYSDGSVHTTDSILIEKVIERIEPLVVWYEKKEWGKLIIGLMTIFFVISSIIWNKIKKKQHVDNTTNN